MDGKSKLLLFGTVTPGAYRGSDFSGVPCRYLPESLCGIRSGASSPPLARPPLLSGGKSPDVTMAASFFTSFGRREQCGDGCRLHGTERG